MAIKEATGIATIDVVLASIKEASTENEFIFETSSQVSIAPDVETSEPIKLVIKGKLRAQKRGTKTITGHTITLTDNVFTPELVELVQGGTFTRDSGGTGKITKYEPPKAGEDNKTKIFELCLYSAIYDESGSIVGYEKITYPNCEGAPIEISRKDDEFSVSTYTITSAPKKGQAPYTIDYVSALPTVAV